MGRILGVLRDFLSFVISSFFTNECLICHIPLYEPDGIIPGSIQDGWPEGTVIFLQNRFSFNILWGISLPGKVLCNDCWLKLRPVSDYTFLDDIPVIAPFRTNETLLKVIRYLKFSGGISVAKPLSWWMAKALRNYASPCDSALLIQKLIIPVPLHNSRRRERGYNQASLLASCVSAELGCRFSADLLVRVRNTKSQSSLDAPGRRENVLKAFDVLDINKFYDKDIVLVDDLVTTGETARECIRILKLNGFSNIIVLSAGKSLSAAD